MLALAGGVTAVPLGPLGPTLPVAHAQVAPTQQQGISFGSVNNLNGDWEASVFFESEMTVRTVSIDFVPPDSTNPREFAPADDPVFTRIPEVAEYRVDHMKGTQVLASYDVKARRSRSTSASGHPSIRISYELPGVQVGRGERLALFAPGKGAQYPTPLRGGGARFTRPTVNADIRGSVTMHDATADEYKQAMVELRQGAETFTSPVRPDGSYEVAAPSPSGTMAITVVPPAGFATPEPKTWEAAEGLAAPDFDVYPITVSGSLIDASDNPVQGATVAIAGRSTTTDKEGNFTVTKVPAGTHDLVFGETTTTESRTVNGVVVSDQRDNAIGQYKVDEKPQFGTVAGRVTDPDNQGVADVTVQAGGQSVKTTADGDYVITGVPAGLTTIKVTAAPAKYGLPAPEQVTLTGRGTETVDFELTLKPAPKPSTTTSKPAPTTTKPSTAPTTPKPTTKASTPKPAPTPKPSPTKPPVPTVGSVAGKVTDAAGKAVPGASVTARDAKGKAYTVAVAKDGTFQLSNLPPGSYTVTVGVPKGHVAPPPANVTVKAGQTVRLPGFVVNPEKPKARFDWDRVVVKPGETQVSAPKRSGDTTSAPSFRTTGVTKVGPDGKTTQIPAENRWISVEKDGTVVARPPRDAAPGEYRVVAKDNAGQTHTITVEVAQPAPMAKQHEVRFPLIPVLAGASRQAGRPRATVTDGPFVYQDRRVPEGARFDVDPAFASWVRADNNGRLTFTPPRDAKPGIRTIPVKVTFPDKSFRAYNAEVEIGDPLLALTTELGYEDGLSVRPGEGITVLRTGTTVLPQGTTFEIDRSTPLDGWVALVDTYSGDLRLFAPTQGSDVEVPVIAYFADGSSTRLTAGVGLSTSSALSTKHSPSYADISSASGGTATVGLTGTVPAGTTFAVVDGGGLRNVGVDRQTGSLKIQLAPDAQRDTPYTVTVRVRYADGSTEEITAKVTAVSDAVRFSPQVTGGEGTSVRTGLPRGAKLADFDHDGWDVAYDSATGELTATPSGEVPAGTVLKVPVQATFPDGSTKIVEYPVAAAAPAAKTQQGSSESAGWIAVVLGALAAIAGIGYAVFLNQDAVRAQLKQFGF
ncbi:hypothetical protein HMPREF3151_01735 [Corynebacterium sp. HMSC05H05]|nr:hypothetical protein HMPREF3151_01735 [Corynebacterium sp. HMSC05H05]